MPAAFIKIAGDLIQDSILESVEVTQALNEHWWCAVECRQTLDRRMPIESSLGQDIQIVTYGQDGAEHVAFDGFVLKAKLLYEIFGSYTIHITGVSRSYKLDLTRQEFYFRKKTLSDVAETLAGQDGLSASVNCTLLPAKNYVQWGESDFDFLKRLAYQHQAWIRPNAQGIEIFSQFQGGSTLVWRQEQGLLSFRVRGQISQPAFSGTHYDARQMASQTFTKVAKSADFSGSSGPMVAAVQREAAKFPSGFVHLDSRAATGPEYQQLLEIESVRSVGSAVTAHGTSMNDALRAGDKVEIQGTLDASGSYGITRVTHHWLRTGYRNEFSCTPWTQYVSPEPPKPVHLAGFVPARVVDHNDPRKMGRLQVQYDWLEDGQTAWARMSTPHAGADRGFMFMPEKGDEVLVGFEHGDPERPFIVGSLWNGVDQAPRIDFWDGDIEPNDVKRIVTKSGHRIQLSDKEGKESIVIATPTHLKIGMLEKSDETNRSMIVAYSDNGDITLSAPNGRIHFQSQYFSREVGVTGSAPNPSPASPVVAAPPQPDFAAQVATMQAAAKSGAALCPT
jgi:type VI secretion system secreted protein VgrG